MGITGFYSWIHEKYGSCINIRKKPTFVNHIYIDLNYLLHMCVYNSSSIEETIIKISSMILDICANYHALDTINISCDGSAPLAKLFLQRMRRLQEARTLYSNNNIKQDLKNSSLHFTPGSVFMSNIHEKLDSVKLKLESTLNVKVNINNLDSGEAEIKNKYLINKHIDENPLSTHLLVTNDADVLLIVGATKIYQNIYVLLKHNNILCLKDLINLHSESFGHPEYSKYPKYPQYDFAFLNLFNGNDYLPKLRYTTIDKIWESYKLKLRKHKEGLVLDKDSKTGRFQINQPFLLDILKSVVAKIPLQVMKKTRLFEYKHYEYSNYVDGLIWCFQMYFEGRCNYNSYLYNSENTPDALLLICHLMSHNINSHFNLNLTKAISNNLCSILLLPNIARELIDKKYYEFMDKHKYLYEEEMCEKCQEFHKTASSLNKIYKEGMCEDKKIRKQITNNQHLYESHRDIHIKLTPDIIEKIKKEYEVLFIY
jgi:5'-3' exonuclease